MHGLILAGGEGSRLAADGVVTPKALVPLGGRPQIVRQIDMLTQLGCPSITCMIRRGLPTGWRTSIEIRGIPVQIKECDTPSSLHTLAAGLALVPEGPVFCTMVDTVMPPREWTRLFGLTTRWLLQGSDAVLAVAVAQEDDHPLWVLRNERGVVQTLPEHSSGSAIMTAGIYAFSAATRVLADLALEAGISRMRGFLRFVLSQGLVVGTVDVPRVVDLDRKRDLAAAEALVRE
jgi:NDP-sugar pyrophosphorylase family protein